MCAHSTAYVEVIAQKLQTFVALSCDYGVLNHLSFTMAVCENGLFSWRFILISTCLKLLQILHFFKLRYNYYLSDTQSVSQIKFFIVKLFHFSTILKVDDT